jgi:hypothetical protein
VLLPAILNHLCHSIWSHSITALCSQGADYFRSVGLVDAGAVGLPVPFE